MKTSCDPVIEDFTAAAPSGTEGPGPVGDERLFQEGAQMSIDSSPRQAAEEGGYTPAATIGDSGADRPAALETPGQVTVARAQRCDGCSWRNCRLPTGPLDRQCHRQRLFRHPVQRAKRRRHLARPLARGARLAGWDRGDQLPSGQAHRAEPVPEVPQQGWARYFKFTMDHKVVGIQYLFGVLTFLFTGGLLAMAIRTELLTPANHVFGPGTYIAVVGEHGTIMMMMASSAVVGPLGNYLVPLMIGSRRVAFPRVEAASFWVFSAGYFVILTALRWGGSPTGWTGYAPLQTQGAGGMDSYLIGFATIGLGMILAGSTWPPPSSTTGPPV